MGDTVEPEGALLAPCNAVRQVRTWLKVAQSTIPTMTGTTIANIASTRWRRGLAMLELFRMSSVWFAWLSVVDLCSYRPGFSKMLENRCKRA